MKEINGVVPLKRKNERPEVEFPNPVVALFKKKKSENYCFINKEINYRNIYWEYSKLLTRNYLISLFIKEERLASEQLSL